MKSCLEYFLLLLALSTIQFRFCSPIVNCYMDPILTQETNPVVHGEGPHWDPETQALYFVDIGSQLVNKYDPSTKKVTHAKLEGSSVVTIVIPVNGSGGKEFIVSSDHDILRITWDHSNTTLDTTTNNENVSVVTSVENDDEHVGNHWNDGKADAHGRLWAGTMGAEPVPGEVELNRGAFYRLDPNSTEALLEERPVSNSNGLIWNQDYTLLYYIDSLKYQVDVFDFDLENGVISNRRKVFSLTENNITGLPDGMTIDSEGNLWIAVFFGGKIINVDPATGTLLRTVEFPVTQVTSMMFGGPNLDILYVTTSRLGLSDEEVAKQPLAGSVFSIECLGVKALVPANNVVRTNT